MIPNAAEVARRRWTVAIILRCIGAAMLPIGAIPLFSWLAEGLEDGDLFDLEYYAGRMIATVILLAMGFALILLSRRGAKLLVPITIYLNCPACAYRLEGLAEPRCPECGLALSPEFMGQAAPRNPALRATASLLRARATLRIVFRAIGILMIPYVATYLISVLFFLTSSPFGEYYSLADLVQYVGSTIIFSVFTYALIVHPDTLARWAAAGPPRSKCAPPAQGPGPSEHPTSP